MSSVFLSRDNCQIVKFVLKQIVELSKLTFYYFQNVKDIIGLWQLYGEVFDSCDVTVRMSSVLVSRDNCQIVKFPFKQAVELSKLTFYYFPKCQRHYLTLTALRRGFWQLWRNSPYVECLRVTWQLSNCQISLQTDRRAIKNQKFRFYLG